MHVVERRQQCVHGQPEDVWTGRMVRRSRRRARCRNRGADRRELVLRMARLFFAGNNEPFNENGGYMKLREISVGYTFDSRFVKNSLGLSSVDVRLAGRNLKTWTKYTGYDPETNLGGATGTLARSRLFQSAPDPLVRHHARPQPLIDGGLAMRKSLMIAGAASIAIGSRSVHKLPHRPTRRHGSEQSGEGHDCQLFTGSAGSAISATGRQRSIRRLPLMQQCQGVGGRFVEQGKPVPAHQQPTHLRGVRRPFIPRGGLIDIRDDRGSARMPRATCNSRVSPRCGRHS